MHSAQILQLIDKILDYIKTCKYFLTFFLYGRSFQFKLLQYLYKNDQKKKSHGSTMSVPLSAAALLPSIVRSCVLFESSRHYIHVPTSTTM